MLVDADFALIGEWRVASDALTLDGRAPSDGDVYTFVLEGDVVYVGVTQNGLPTRMEQYRRGHPGNAPIPVSNFSLHGATTPGC